VLPTVHYNMGGIIRRINWGEVLNAHGEEPRPQWTPRLDWLWARGGCASVAWGEPPFRSQQPESTSWSFGRAAGIKAGEVVDNRNTAVPTTKRRRWTNPRSTGLTRLRHAKGTTTTPSSP